MTIEGRNEDHPFPLNFFWRLIMNLKLITPPRGEPVGVEEAKRYLRVETSDDQEIIENLITTARLAVESYTGRTLMTQT
jgi:uncharacterized phiE125 gp8 family phage protein